MFGHIDQVHSATLKLANDYLTLLSAQRWNEWIAPWADEGELDFPFAPSGRQRSYRGKDEILAYMRATAGRVAIDGIAYSRIFPMQEPQMAIAELAIRGHVPTSGVAYNQSYVAFFETRKGKLWHYREYWNPLVSIDALGGREAWAAGFAPDSDHEESRR